MEIDVKSYYGKLVNSPLPKLTEKDEKSLYNYIRRSGVAFSTQMSVWEHTTKILNRYAK